MARFKITYYGSSGAASKSKEVEATVVDHEGDWIIFKDGRQPVLSERANNVKRYERIEKGEGDGVPSIA